MRMIRTLMSGTGAPTHTPAPASVRRPMVWVFTGYQGQVAVRIGNFKVVRQGLLTKKPGAWEVYDIVQDRGETRDLSASRRDLIDEARRILAREVSPNPIFPMNIPD